ncbi:MAG: signal recognition particle-docking protein FtsY [Pirellula sp.]
MIFWKKKKSASNDDSTANIPVTIPESVPESVSGRSHESPGQDFQVQETPPDSQSRLQADAPIPEVATSETTATKVSWFKRALQKTNDLLRTDIRDLWKSEGELVDEAFLSNLYAILIRTDMGPSMATKIKDSIYDQYRARKVHQEDVLRIIRDRVAESLKSKGGTLNLPDTKPAVILVVGVNGSGKTTSIAKIAHRLTRQGKRVLLAAGDTFRAAAVEQLRIWADRIGCDIVMGDQGSDPASVAFKAMQRAVEEGYDVCIVDTAGRLQTQSHLMQQLEKIKRVLQKHVETAPHEVLLVLDATAGQNAISQAKGFSEAAGCTGIVLSKLDGTAKGGVIIPIAEQFGLPVKFIGIGEKLPDLQEFSPDDFAAALFS